MTFIIRSVLVPALRLLRYRGGRGLLLLALCLAPGVVAALPDGESVADSAVAPGAIWQSLETVRQRLQQIRVGDPLKRLPPDLVAECDITAPGLYQAEALRELAEEQSGDHGFSVNGFYTTEDVRREDGGRGAGYLEFSWELLHGGEFGNEKQAEVLHARAGLEEYRSRLEQAQRLRRCRRDGIHRLFAPVRADILSLRLSLLEPVHDLEEQAYFKGWSFLDELLVSQRDLLLTQRELQYLQTVARGAGTAPPPVIDLNMPGVLEAIAGDETPARLNELQNTLARAERDARRREQLRLFLRQEIDQSGDPEDLVAGLRFSVPLGRNPATGLESTLAYNDSRAELAVWERTALVRSSYLEVREQLERVIKAQYLFSQSQERLRRSLAEHRLDNQASLPAAIQRTLDLLANADELLAAKEVLYRRVSGVLLHARLDFDPRFVDVIPSQGDHRARTGRRGVYLWSGAFNSLANQRLVDLAQAKGVGEFIVSAGSQTDHAKLEALLARADRPRVSLLLGDAAWVRPENHERAVATIARIASRYPLQRMHLDIEPQQLPDYGTARERLLEEYLRLIRAVRGNLAPDTPLDLSVPVHWPATTYRRLAEAADNLCLMAYGDGSAQAVIARLRDVVADLPPRKLCLALRAGDFANEWELESELRAIAEQTAIRRFAVHDFQQWLELFGGGDETAQP